MRSRGLLTELLGHPRRESVWAQVLGWLVRARAEITVATILVTSHILLITHAGMSTRDAVLAETAAVTLIIILPGGRARMWAVCSRHRIWKCFVQTRTMTPDGKLPYLLWSSPSPIGERVKVWLPAGLSVNDINQITEAIAAACFAADARTEVNTRWTHLVTIIVIRRNPLTGKRLVKPGTGLFPPRGDTFSDAFRDFSGFADLPARDTLPPMPVATAPAEHPTVRGAKTRTTRTHNGAPNGAANGGKPTPQQPATPRNGIGVGGMDVSDYVDD